MSVVIPVFRGRPVDELTDAERAEARGKAQAEIVFLLEASVPPPEIAAAGAEPSDQHAPRIAMLERFIADVDAVPGRVC